MIRNTVAHRILLLFAGLVLCSGCLIDRIGGAFTKAPEEFERSGSSGARKLVDEAFAGIDPSRLVDFHTHVIAIGTSVPDAFVNPKMPSGVNLERLKFLIYASASAVKNIYDNARANVDRLIPPPRRSPRPRRFPL